jgi:hypothetical protein
MALARDSLVELDSSEAFAFSIKPGSTSPQLAQYCEDLLTPYSQSIKPLKPQ